MLGGSSMLRFTTGSSRVPGSKPDTTVSDVVDVNMSLYTKKQY